QRGDGRLAPRAGRRPEGRRRATNSRQSPLNLKECFDGTRRELPRLTRVLAPAAESAPATGLSGFRVHRIVNGIGGPLDIFVDLREFLRVRRAGFLSRGFDLLKGDRHVVEIGCDFLKLPVSAHVNPLVSARSVDSGDGGGRADVCQWMR